MEQQFRPLTLQVALSDGIVYVNGMVPDALLGPAWFVSFLRGILERLPAVLPRHEFPTIPSQQRPVDEGS